MPRSLILAVLVLPLLASCATGGVRYSPGSFRLTAPLNDNAAASCAAAPVLLPVPAGSSRMLHLRLTQGAFAWEDSCATLAGLEWAVLPPDVPAAGPVTVLGWASDLGGEGCPVTLTRTPLAIRVPPATPTLVAY
jgi:hypothetical protein